MTSTGRLPFTVTPLATTLLPYVSAAAGTSVHVISDSAVVLPSFMRTVAFTPLSASRTASADAPSGTEIPAIGSTDAGISASLFTTVIVHLALTEEPSTAPSSAMSPSLPKASVVSGLLSHVTAAAFVEPSDMLSVTWVGRAMSSAAVLRATESLMSATLSTTGTRLTVALTSKLPTAVLPVTTTLVPSFLMVRFSLGAVQAIFESISDPSFIATFTVVGSAATTASGFAPSSSVTGSTVPAR